MKLVKLLIGSVLALSAMMSFAEPYKIYVPVPAGTVLDVFVRKLVDSAQAASDKTFIILNKPGGDFMLAYRAFLQDSSSGALYLSTVTSHVVPYVIKNDLNVDPLKDTQPVVLGTNINYTLSVKADSKIKSVADITGKKNIGYIGNVAPLLLKSLKLDKDVQLIPYKSETEVIMALKAGDIDVAQISNGAQIERNGLRIVTKLDQVMTGFVGVHAKTSMSADEVVALNAVFSKALQTEDLKKFARDQFASDASQVSPLQFGDRIKGSVATLQRISNAPVH